MSLRDLFGVGMQRQAADVGCGELRIGLTWAEHVTSSLFGIAGEVSLHVLREAYSAQMLRKMMGVGRGRVIQAQKTGET
jgi:hypothetical protein